jgi:NAD/NADP transhydrogenase alpha subunit
MLNPFDKLPMTGLQRLAAAGLTSFALEAAPRTTRAQSMDVLSSQANIAGYKAVMIAADKYQRLFPMLMTAAGTVKAARVVILGVGVAGLQAIATAKRLGAVIEASDVRPRSRSRSSRWAPSSSTCPTTPPRKRKPPSASAATPSRCRRAGWSARRSRSPSAWPRPTS